MTQSGRKREYGQERAKKLSISWDPKLLQTFREESARLGYANMSRAVQNAVRLWLQLEARRSESLAPMLGKIDKRNAGHVHVVLPKDFWEALAIHATRIGRTIPDIAREGLALYVRAQSSAPEFRDVEEWRFLGSEDCAEVTKEENRTEIRGPLPPIEDPEGP